MTLHDSQGSFNLREISSLSPFIQQMLLFASTATIPVWTRKAYVSKLVCYMYICVAFKSHTVWSCEHVNTLATSILQTAMSTFHSLNSPLQRGKTPPNECPVYDTKQSDGEVPAVLELWGMRNTPSLSSLPGPLWPGVVAPDRVLSMG